jgi:hypothetical protein
MNSIGSQTYALAYVDGTKRPRFDDLISQQTVGAFCKRAVRFTGLSDRDKISESLKMWRPLNSAPYGVDLELASIDDEGERCYELPCRKSVSGWIDSKWQSPIDFMPTHWRLWKADPKSLDPDVEGQSSATAGS